MILELDFDEIFVGSNLHISMASSGLKSRAFLEQEVFLVCWTGGLLPPLQDDYSLVEDTSCQSVWKNSVTTRLVSRM
jgi:hypothetical protein